MRRPVVDPRFGVLMRQLREQQGKTLRSLAARTQISKSRLHELEVGTARPDVETAALVDAALGADGRLKALITPPDHIVTNRTRPAVDLEDAWSAGDRSGGTVHDVYRRTFVSLGAKAAMTVAMAAGINLGSLDRRLDATDVERLQRVVARLRTHDQEHGSADLWDVAADRAHGIASLLEHADYSQQVGAALVELTGRAYMCAGWLATDAGRNDVAHGFYTEALSYADQAGSPEIRVHALLNLALHAQILQQPRQMLRYLDAAERALPADPPGRVPAVVLMRRGRALAMLGDREDAGRAFGAAHTSLDADDNPPASWLPWMGHAEIDALEADAAVDLDEPDRGADLLERSLPTYDTQFARNRCLHIVRMSKARVRAGEVEGAAQSTGTALDLLHREVASVRVGAELEALAGQLRPHRALPAVAEVLDRYEATPYAATA